MAVGMNIALAEVPKDQAVNDWLRRESKAYADLYDTYGEELTDTKTMKSIFNKGTITKGSLRRLMEDYVAADYVVYTLHGGNHTEICESLEGNRYRRGDSVPTPPLHFNCKSTLTPESRVLA